MNSLVVFFDSSDIGTKILLPKILAACRSDEGVREILLLSASGIRSRRQNLRRAAWAITCRLMQIACGSGRWEASLGIAPLDLGRLAREYRASLAKLPNGDPNAVEVIDRIGRLSRPKLGLNIYCRRLFGHELRGHFDSLVNYHNGELPRFRGLRCSNWSIFSGSRTSAYSFHLMDGGFDTGNVIFSRSIAVDQGDTPAEIEMKKALDAAGSAGRVIESLIRVDKGQAQEAIGCYHNRASCEIATTVVDPSSLTLDEWRLRLKSFLSIRTRIGERWIQVTGIAECTRPESLGFKTMDERLVRVTGIDFWPAKFVKALRRLTGSWPH